MDPALLQQILGAGPLAEQQTQADQELQNLIARRQAYRAQGSKSGAGALLGGIADLIMGHKEGEMRAQQADLAKQMAGVRGQYSQAFLGTPMGPAAPPGMPDNPPRIPLSPEDQSQLATAGELSGDPLMAKAGAGALLRGQQAPKLALEQEQARRAQQENAAMDSPQAALLLRGLATKYGAQVPENTPAALLRGIMPTLEKSYAAGEGKFTVNPMTGQLYDTRTARTAGAGGAGPATIAPEMLDSLARQYAQTGEMPQLRMGRAGIAIYPQILKRAAELHPELDLAGAKAGYKADTGSLGNQQKILDNAEGWERTGKANLDVLLGVARKLQDTGSPWLNRPVRAFMDKGAGDPNQAAFRAAHATVVNEYAKILSGAQGSGAVTEGARHEAESMLPLDATWEQLSAAAKVLDTDAGNRIGAARQQVGQIKGRLSGRQAAPTAAATAPAETVDVISPEGKAGKIPAANLDAALKRGFKRAGP